jgi:uncharacterized protein YndB with AHSA1/START domain
MRQTVTVPSDEPIFIVDREIDAPPELVWKMYTQPEHMVHFWGPNGSTLPVCKVDLRVGGVWFYTMRMPDGNEFSVSSVYTEIVEPQRIAFRDGPKGDQKVSDLPPPSMVSTIAFDDIAGKTRLRVTVRLNSIAERDMTIKMGFANMLEVAGNRLEAYLKTL